MTRPDDLPNLFQRFEANPTTRHKIVVCARELRTLAARRGRFGVTAFDTRQIARRKGWATGYEADVKALCWFAAVPKIARLYRTTRTRTEVNRNASRVYVYHEDWQ